MKYIIKHISLLIFSGLILPVCRPAASLKIIGPVSCCKQHFRVNKPGDELNYNSFSFYQDIATKALPILKSLH